MTDKLTAIPGIGPKTADRLRTLGIDSVKSLSAASTELLSTIPGFFASRAEAVKAAAAEMTAKASRAAASKPKARTTQKAAKPAAAPNLPRPSLSWPAWGMKPCRRPRSGAWRARIRGWWWPD